jgi:hypothetical protein
MSMINNFANDGAQGAGQTLQPGAGTQVGGVTVNDPGPQVAADTNPYSEQDTEYWKPDGTQSVDGGPSQQIYQQIKALPNPGSTSNGVDTDEYLNQFGQYGTLSGSAQNAYAESQPPSNDDVQGLQFSTGGAIPDDDGSDQSNNDSDGTPGQSDAISQALSSVDDILSYGRSLYGLGDQSNGQAIDTASNMPSVPGNQSNSGRPPVQPMPGPLPPTSNPFGKRADGGSDSGQQVAANMPSVPGSQSNSGRPPVQPMPGPLPPTSNPFGKRADAGAIDTDDSEDT